MFDTPILEELEKDPLDDWFQSKPTKVEVLGGGDFDFIIEGYEENEVKEEFHEAIKNFLSIEESVLKKSQDYIYQYCMDILEHLEPEDDWYVEIAKSEDVWKHIQFGCSPVVSRPYRDKLIYISLECFCDWEQEHGLQIVFKQGVFVNKVGSYNGHLTNSDAYANSKFENVVYR